LKEYLTTHQVVFALGNFCTNGGFIFRPGFSVFAIAAHRLAAMIVRESLFFMSTSPSPEAYDLVVLGSGEGGKYLAWALAKQGRKVVVIERRWIGGSCPNIACLPSKNIIHSAKVASYFWRSEEFGIHKEHVHVNMAEVRDRKRLMVAGLVDMHLDLYKKSGAELVLGEGKFIAPKTIEVALSDGGTRTFVGENVVINTGSRALIDPVPGMIEAVPLSQAMRRFGAGVTIIDRNARLAHREDTDVSDALHDLCRDEGIEVATNFQLERVEGRSGEYIKLHSTRDGVPVTIEGTELLVASGRKPNTENIGADIAGVELTSRGFVKVNEHLRATAPGVWAIGDCAGSPHFTHISFDDFRIIRDNLAGNPRVTTGRQVPFCMYTDPEFARIGLSESEAKERGISYRLAKIPMVAVLRTRTLSETHGFMKALVETQSDRILGFMMVGVGAGEVMATVQVAMLADLPYTTLRDAVFTHPTLLEGLIPLFSAVPPRA
jgi:pyruvate/2-oxoglutarate dehydrogenase complex dihydrolipoamide dehydrogenase (E3) component